MQNFRVTGMCVLFSEIVTDFPNFLYTFGYFQIGNKTYYIPIVTKFYTEKECLP